MKDIKVIFCVATAVHQFYFRLALNETPN